MNTVIYELGLQGEGMPRSVAAVTKRIHDWLACMQNKAVNI